MNNSPFSTYRGVIVRRVLIGVCVVAVGLFFLTRVTSGQSIEVEERRGARSLFGAGRAPVVEPPIANPFAVDRDSGGARSRSGVNPSERARFDAAVATATRFAVAYAMVNADSTPESFVEGLPYVSTGLRPTLLLEAKERWPAVQRDRMVAAARPSSIPPEMLVYTDKVAQARVQVLQDISATGGQRTSTLNYRVEMEWDPNAPVRPELLPSAPPAPRGSGSGSAPPVVEGGPEPDPSPPSPSASGPTGAWQVTKVLQL